MGSYFVAAHAVVQVPDGDRRVIAATITTETPQSICVVMGHLGAPNTGWITDSGRREILSRPLESGPVEFIVFGHGAGPLKGVAEIEVLDLEHGIEKFSAPLEMWRSQRMSKS